MPDVSKLKNFLFSTILKLHVEFFPTRGGWCSQPKAQRKEKLELPIIVFMLCVILIVFQE